MHDLIIRGGTVVDGTGAPARKADIAINGDRIVAVGTDVGEGKREIDATNRLVSPGWVDVHTHYDGQVTWDPHLTPSGWNGVTTVVMGNCGVGFAPVRPGQQEYLIQLMEGVEDIPGTALSEGMTWDWETFPEYLDSLERIERSVDVGTQVPHGPIRTYVMGERGANNEKANAEEITEMAKLVKESLEAGALGFTTSRTMVHRAKDGEVVPGTYADEDEIFGIGRMLGEVGHGVFEVASDLAPEGDELSWMSRLGKETGRPVSFACLQNPIDADQWKRLIEAVDKDAAEGGCLTPQVAQRPAGLLLGFESSSQPFMLHDVWKKELGHLAPDARVAKLRDPEIKRRLIEEGPDENSVPLGPLLLILQAWQMMFPLGDPPEYEPAPECSIQAISEREGRTPREVAYDLMMQNDGRGMIYLPLLGYSNGDLEPIREMMMHPRSVFSLSDGGAHCGLIADASVPTYLLTHWVRDRSRGERIELETIVEQQTRNTARFYGFDDRGTLEPGMLADINVIDFEGLHIHPPTMVYDLPAGGNRLIQQIDGYSYTIKSGEVTFEEGQATGALPGTLLRGPQPGPAA
ncbi:MAG: amidohydrolase family protein [Myxococcota bacterium]|nr:amidohydrolase family protein [Myxococcota bacterium]